MRSAHQSYGNPSESVIRGGVGVCLPPENEKAVSQVLAYLQEHLPSAYAWEASFTNTLIETLPDGEWASFVKGPTEVQLRLSVFPAAKQEPVKSEAEQVGVS